MDEGTENSIIFLTTKGTKEGTKDTKKVGVPVNVDNIELE